MTENGARVHARASELWAAHVRGQLAAITQECLGDADFPAAWAAALERLGCMSNDEERAAAFEMDSGELALAAIGRIRPTEWLERRLAA